MINFGNVKKNMSWLEDVHKYGIDPETFSSLNSKQEITWGDMQIVGNIKILIGMIEDLNERLASVQHDLDVAGIPHDEKFRVQS